MVPMKTMKPTNDRRETMPTMLPVGSAITSRPTMCAPQYPSWFVSSLVDGKEQKKKNERRRTD